VIYPTGAVYLSRIHATRASKGSGNLGNQHFWTSAATEPKIFLCFCNTGFLLSPPWFVLGKFLVIIKGINNKKAASLSLRNKRTLVARHPNWQRRLPITNFLIPTFPTVAESKASENQERLTNRILFFLSEIYSWWLVNPVSERCSFSPFKGILKPVPLRRSALTLSFWQGNAISGIFNIALLFQSENRCGQNKNSLKIFQRS
jgi:hypothetical protein